MTVVGSGRFARPCRWASLGALTAKPKANRGVFRRPGAIPIHRVATSEGATRPAIVSGAGARASVCKGGAMARLRASGVARFAPIEAHGGGAAPRRRRITCLPIMARPIMAIQSPTGATAAAFGVFASREGRVVPNTANAAAPFLGVALAGAGATGTRRRSGASRAARSGAGTAAPAALLLARGGCGITRPLATPLCGAGRSARPT